MIIEINFDRTKDYLHPQSMLDRFIFNFDISNLECANDNKENKNE